MRYLLVVATAAGLSLATPSFAGDFAAGQGFHSAGGCGFSTARLASLIKARTPEPMQPTTETVTDVLALPQVATLLQPEPVVAPKPTVQR